MDLERFFLLIHTILKTWGKRIPIVRKNMGKHKYLKVKGFLNISPKTKIHAIPKAWNEWIPIKQKKYGKKQTINSTLQI